MRRVTRDWPIRADPLPDAIERRRPPEALTEDALVHGYRNAVSPPRTDGDGTEDTNRALVPVDWDLAVGEPLARGRTPRRRHDD